MATNGFGIVLIFGVCQLCLLIAFVACGNSQPNAQPTLDNGNPSPTQVVSSDGSTTPGSQIAPTTDESSPPIHIDCGELAIAGNPAQPLDSAENVSAASACFVQAYNSCTAATLTVRERDTQVIRQFTIEPGTRCDVREALQPDPNSPPAVVDCASVRAEKNGLVISACSHLGDFILTP